MTFQLGQPVVRTWDAEQFARLQELASHPDKLSAAQIADKMGWPTRNAVIGACRRFGIALQLHPRTFDQSKPPRRPRGKAKPKAVAPPAFKHEPRPEPELIEIPAEQRKTLLQLTKATCRWPVGDPGDPDFFFCGGQTKEGSPYCAYHSRVAYVAPIKPNRAKPFIAQRGRAA